MPVATASANELSVSAAAMAASSSITCASAKDAIAVALGAPPPSTAGATGVTTFIKQELVADGGLAPAVRPPGKGFKRKNASKRGLQLGRSFDAAFQVAVLGGARTTEVARALRVLGQADVVVVKCQHRVVTAANKLTTMIDAVGMLTRPPYTAVCIELKTCQLDAADYPAYAVSACRRTPMLRCQLPNTERNRHSLQAAYGAMALSATFGSSPRAYVLVSCRDKALLHEVEPAFYAPALYTRLTAVTTVRKPRPAARGDAPNLASLMAGWPAGGDAILEKVRLHRHRKQASRRVWAASAVKGGPVTAMILHVPRWRALRTLQRTGFVAKLRRVAQLHPDAGKTVAMYVLATFIPGQQPTLLPIAAPFVQRGV